MRRKRRRRGRRIRLFAFGTEMLLAAVCLLLWTGSLPRGRQEGAARTGRTADGRTAEASDGLSEDLLGELLEKNPEMLSFVEEYPNREKYLRDKIDLREDEEIGAALAAGQAPLLMQWDTRWGYAPYGNELVGLAGCGPTCLSMACLYLTGDLTKDPACMAEFAYEEGFYTERGTDWSLWTLGAERLGLAGEQIAPDEREIRRVLDDGGVVVCSMRPGDFTTTGHMILLRGYDENGFFVNDPNRRSNSVRQWTYGELSGQIKNLWGIRKES